MRIDRYVHDERLTWGAAGVLLIVTAVHVAGISGLFLTNPKPGSSTALAPVFQVSLEKLPPLELPPSLEPDTPPEAANLQDLSKAPPKKTRPVPILVDTPVTNPVPPDTQVKQYERGDELLEGEPGPPSPPGAVVGGTGEATALPSSEVPVVQKIELVSMTPPVYPPRCLRMGLEGVVRVRVLVGENGRPAGGHAGEVERRVVDGRRRDEGRAGLGLQARDAQWNARTGLGRRADRIQTD